MQNIDRMREAWLEPEDEFIPHEQCGCDGEQDCECPCHEQDFSPSLSGSDEEQHGATRSPDSPSRLHSGGRLQSPLSGQFGVQMITVIVPPEFWPILLEEADRLKMQPPEALIKLAIQGKEHARLCQK